MGLEPTTSLLHAVYTYVYKCMHRYICLGFCDIIALKFVLIYTWIWTDMQGIPSKYLMQKYIYVTNKRQNERVLLISRLTSWIQHTSKPWYAKFGAFRRKWKSNSHIRYTVSRTARNKYGRFWIYVHRSQQWQIAEGLYLHLQTPLCFRFYLLKKLELTNCLLCVLILFSFAT